MADINSLLAATALLPPLPLAAVWSWLEPTGWSLLACLGVGVLGALLYGLLVLFRPKLAAIALTTGKEAVLQPLFVLFVAIGAVALVAYPYIPYMTFGEDIKVLKDSGMTTIMVLGIMLSLWTASFSIAEEIEGRTALTLLSKPIRRWEFIVGKFTGIVGATGMLFLILGSIFFATVAFKVVYDAKENSLPPPEAIDCAREVVQVAPGLALAYMETIVLTSISVALSTRLPLLANLLICASIYALGHLGPALVDSLAGRFEIVAFVGRLITVVIPVLDHFNIQAAVATGKFVPLDYLAWGLLYCVVYSTLALLLALVLFEDRDLA